VNLNGVTVTVKFTVLKNGEATSAGCTFEFTGLVFFGPVPAGCQSANTPLSFSAKEGLAVRIDASAIAESAADNPGRTLNLAMTWSASYQ
jgi:hypothetical protein